MILGFSLTEKRMKGREVGVKQTSFKSLSRVVADEASPKTNEKLRRRGSDHALNFFFFLLFNLCAPFLASTKNCTYPAPCFFSFNFYNFNPLEYSYFS